MKLIVTLAALFAVSPAFAFDLGFGRPYDHSMQATGTSELGLPPIYPARGHRADSCLRFGTGDDACAIHGATRPAGPF